MVIIPLYHKIRISHDTIIGKVTAQDVRLYEPLRHSHRTLIPERIEWDVYLTYGHAVQKSIRTTPGLDPDYRYAVIMQQYPRFVWRATGRCKDVPLVDLLYDATDIETGRVFLGPIFYDSALRNIVMQKP
jgi:hypothetical protein